MFFYQLTEVFNSKD